MMLWLIGLTHERLRIGARFNGIVLTASSEQ